MNLFVYDVIMTMPNGERVTERLRAEDEGYAARQAAANWGFKTRECEYRFEVIGEVTEDPAESTADRPR